MRSQARVWEGGGAVAGFYRLGEHPFCLSAQRHAHTHATAILYYYAPASHRDLGDQVGEEGHGSREAGDEHGAQCAAEAAHGAQAGRATTIDHLRTRGCKHARFCLCAVGDAGWERVASTKRARTHAMLRRRSMELI